MTTVINEVCCRCCTLPDTCCIARVPEEMSDTQPTLKEDDPSPEGDPMLFIGDYTHERDDNFEAFLKAAGETLNHDHESASQPLYLLSHRSPISDSKADHHDDTNSEHIES